MNAAEMDIARRLNGMPVSPGIAVGEAHIIERGMPDAPEYCVTEAYLEDERLRFLRAIDQSRQQLDHVHAHLKESAEKDQDAHQYKQELVYILDAHRLILEDAMFQKGVLGHISEHRCNAEWAVKRYLGEVIAVFQNMEDAYLREKRRDIEQIGQRILHNLMGNRYNAFAAFPNPVILVAEDFTPADTLLMDHEAVLGFVTEAGGSTSHTAILARALGIPAVVAVPHVTEQVRSGDRIVLDGISGTLHLSPDDEEQAGFDARRKQYHASRAALLEIGGAGVETPDGRRVGLKANIDFQADVVRAAELGVDGIGLFRTENLYMNRSRLPSEEELVELFTNLVETMEGKPVTIRTLDIGGDKQSEIFLQRLSHNPSNPALGLRGLRLCLKSERAAFFTQLRAILRAGAGGDVQIMFPMVTRLAELKEALLLLDEAKKSLRLEEVPFVDNPQVGIMIEVPSAALCADQLAPYADFFSIGANDLTQFTLAVDRGDESVAELYSPVDPSVLRLIRMTIQAGDMHHTPIAVCGEMAGDPRYAVLLMGLGIDELSVTPERLPLIRKTICGVEYRQAVDLARTAMEMVSAEEITDHLDRFLKAAFGSAHRLY
ncbi:MAG: phosphoenolpyruvate--protein phosphotransferase [Magnetococcales bacterium]|nr:phosphoenolpyruvate--protein phosphotransferase [Magnetococcales bacterium]